MKDENEDDDEEDFDSKTFRLLENLCPVHLAERHAGEDRWPRGELSGAGDGCQ